MNTKEQKSFLTYLLSKKRNKKVSKLNKNNITHADYENWRYDKFKRDLIFD